MEATGATDTAEDTSGREEVFPGWLDGQLVPDAKFARAYDSLGDAGRGLLKRVIAAHFALNPPAASLATTRLDVLRCGLTVAADATPLDYALIVCDGGMDAPAFLLPALVPALCSGIAEVLVVRLGKAGGISRSTLAACELAGQERVAGLGPQQLEALLAHLATSAQNGVVIHADTPAVRKVLARPGLGALLSCPGIRRIALPMPTRCGVWSDGEDSMPLDCISQLYGPIPFAQGGLEGEGEHEFEDFSAYARDLLLVPDSRVNRLFLAVEQGARVTVSRSQLGLWLWPQISAATFLSLSTIFSSER